MIRRILAGAWARRWFFAIGLAVCLVLSTVLSVAHADATRVVVGASGSVDDLAQDVGRPLAAHRYSDLGDTAVTDARYVNVQADQPGQWEAIATGYYDAEIERWANALAATGRPRLIAFNHEPSVSANNGAGTPAEFRRAFRRFASIMHDLAPRVSMVFAVTQRSLSSRHTPDSPERFWPGGESVDAVSSNSFNRSGCDRKAEPWISFGAKVDPLLDLARAHSKPVIVSEFGADAGPDRARWLRSATRYVANHPLIEGLFYYNSPWNDTCAWRLGTQAEYRAIGAMVERLR